MSALSNGFFALGGVIIGWAQASGADLAKWAWGRFEAHRKHNSQRREEVIRLIAECAHLGPPILYSSQQQLIARSRGMRRETAPEIIDAGAKFNQISQRMGTLKLECAMAGDALLAEAIAIAQDIIADSVKLIQLSRDDRTHLPAFVEEWNEGGGFQVLDEMAAAIADLGTGGRI